jgi:glycosyltransferase involved in cell wall biosynthesis
VADYLIEATSMNRKQRRAAKKARRSPAYPPKPGANAASDAQHATIAGVNANGRTIGLCMIVKNESKVILRCLESVRPIVDYVLIEDTGSTDGTQAIIREWLDRVGLPGEVYDEPWQDFAYNRSHALAGLRQKKDLDYALVMDADDVMVFEDGFDSLKFKKSLAKDQYDVSIHRFDVTYFRPQICSNRLQFKYRGVLHEFLEGPRGGYSTGTAAGLYIDSSGQGGARSEDPEKYRKDAQILERALRFEKDPFLRARYTFYLAQTYRGYGDDDKALKAYLARSKMGFWDQEVYWSLYMAAHYQEALGRPVDEVLSTYAKASNACRSRAEALREASRLCRLNNRFEEGYQFAKRGLAIRQPEIALFTVPWIYEYGLLDEFAINAYWTERYQECLDACQRLLREGKMPPDMHDRVKKNAEFAAEKIRLQSLPATNKTICLNMIVKNEVANLERCLHSVADHISCWVIGDTGSTDGTQELIEQFFAARSIPGELHSFPFENFAQARNEALNRARASALPFDYILLTDADMELTVQNPAFSQDLTAAAYKVLQRSGVTYWNIRLLRRDVPARYIGVTHEYLEVSEPGNLEGISFIDHATGSNRVDKYQRDIRLLTDAIATERDPGLIARYTFYLANTQRDSGDKEAALKTFLERARLGHWYQEVFISLLNAAQLKEALEYTSDDVISAYMEAAAACPTRAEALHGAARFCRIKGIYERGYEFAKQGLAIPCPNEALFAQDWIYEYGLLDELAINSYWTERYAECVDACDRLLSEGKLPTGDRDRVLKNKNFAVGKQQETVASSSPETRALQKLLRAAREKEKLARPNDEVISAYMEAAASCPTRAEALHGAARFCRNKGIYERGYEFAAQGLAVAFPKGAPAVEDWIYQYGLLDEFAVNAYWTARYSECVDACDRLLNEGKLPTEERDRVLKNKQFALDKLRQPPVPGSFEVMIWPAGSASPSIPLAMPAVATPRGISGMVSIITPTRNRDRFLKRALTYFRSQDYENIEWLILDDSPQRTESLDDIDDRNIFYQHVGEKVPIGEKRNILIEKAKGEIIIQFDDDDYYAPNYVRSMLSALADRDADLVNLRGWFLYDLRSHFFGYWDLMQKEGPYYCCDRMGVALGILSPELIRGLENTHLGYGFSYVFKKKVWEAVKFPAIDLYEDEQFSLKAQSKFKVDGIHDTTGLCLHFLHPDSTSRCFPQHHLPQFLFQRLFPALEYPAPIPAVDQHGSTSNPSGHVALCAVAATDVPREQSDMGTPARYAIAPQSSWAPAQPLGGTELMVEGLRQHLGNALDAINLCINSYEEAHLDTRPLVVWVHLDVDQVPTQWFHDKEKVRCVTWFVFVSNWQRARFIDRFELRPEVCIVLRNATDINGPNRRWNPGKPLKMAYISTPYRGLAVLLDAWNQLRPAESELHIWSSIKLYGPRFNDEAYRKLYDRALSLPGIEYHGIIPNSDLRAALRSIDFLTYPSIFPETSCLSAIEAMAAGCRVICPSLGALPETTGKFARLYPFLSDPADHAKSFAKVLTEEIRNPWDGNLELAEEQQNYTRETYAWSVRVAEWKAFIDLIAARPALVDIQGVQSEVGAPNQSSEAPRLQEAQEKLAGADGVI